MNISTTLTCIRITLAPIFGILVYDKLWILAVVVFIAVIVTDFLDGHIARKRGEVTEVGTFLDAAADKIFFASAIFSTYIAFDLPWYVFFMLTRDALVGVGGLILLGMSSQTKRIDFGADWSGKTVTALQAITIGVIFTAHLAMPIRESFIQILIFLTAVGGLLCSIHYLLRTKQRDYI